MTIKFTAFLVGLALSLQSNELLAAEKISAAKQSNEYDVIIYGGTAGGIVAAISAAREGAKVVVLEPTKHLGGMVTGGLGRTDIGLVSSIGGMTDEFYRRLHEYYGRPEAWKWETREQFLRRSKDRRLIANGRWALHEPSAATKVFEEMLKEANVAVLPNHRAVTVTKIAARLHGIKCANGTEFIGRIFIDATYEGDLMALAGVSNRWGREPRNEYNESLAGVLLMGNAEIHHPKEFFGLKVDPYVMPGVASSGLLPGIQTGPRGEQGEGDRKVQAYNFRICLTDHPANRLPITRPEGYDVRRYELLARWIATQSDLKFQSTAGAGGFFLNTDLLPNRKTDLNDGGVFSTDYIGGSWDYPAGDQAARERIIDDHVNYTKGLLYFISQDLRVPEHIRREMQKFGYAKDEYVENEHWSPQLYIREARRLMGEYVMTEQDALTRRSKADSIGLGSYMLDSHHVQRVLYNGQLINEGNLKGPKKKPYEIPYRSLTPRKAECENLLVTFAISASHVAFGSIRMEPVFMILSESAGVAATMAADKNVPVQDVDIPALQKRLFERKQKLKLNDVGDSPDIPKRQRAEN